jgi:UDP-N-acetylmuramate dehydrogenase
MDKIKFARLRGELCDDHNLAQYTSWRVGGNAQRFYRPADLSDLQIFLKQLPDSEPLTCLGLGSNVLIRDGGIPGTVILTLQRLNELSMIDEVTLRAEAGVPCAKLAKWCAERGLEEGGFFAGIPGTVGGALAMNAGAFGQETWRHVIQVETMDHKGTIYQRTPTEFNIDYREIHGLEEQLFVAGHFRFNLGDITESRKKIRHLLRERNRTQPIGQYSCGSVFRNPPGNYAARLIESAGLKGKSIGDAIVSDKHANFILNKGKASAQDIEQLIEYVAKSIYEETGIQLIKEVHILGASRK